LRSPGEVMDASRPVEAGWASLMGSKSIGAGWGRTPRERTEPGPTHNLHIAEIGDFTHNRGGVASLEPLRDWRHGDG
jgi:hypothetical protein